MRIPPSLTRVAVVGCAAALAAGCELDLSTSSFSGDFDRTFTVTGPADLNMSGGSGSIQIDPGPAGVVHVVAHIRASTRGSDDAETRVKRIAAAPPIEQNGNTIRIGEVRDNDLFHNVSISYEITVPAATSVRSQVGSGAQTIGHLAGPVILAAGSGRIRIGQIDGDVLASTGSGSISVERAGGRLDVHTSSGSITAVANGATAAETGSGRIALTQTSPADITATTGSGGIEINGARGAMHVRAGSGRIRIEGQPLNAWDVETGSGGITMQVAGDVPFSLDASSSSGSVDSSQPVNVTGAISRRHLLGTVRGGGPQVRLSTGSGGIRIQ